MARNPDREWLAFRLEMAEASVAAQCCGPFIQLSPFTARHSSDRLARESVYRKAICGGERFPQGSNLLPVQGRQPAHNFPSAVPAFLAAEVSDGRMPDPPAAVASYPDGRPANELAANRDGPEG